LAEYEARSGDQSHPTEGQEDAEDLHWATGLVQEQTGEDRDEGGRTEDDGVGVAQRQKPEGGEDETGAKESNEAADQQNYSSSFCTEDVLLVPCKCHDGSIDDHLDHRPVKWFLRE